MANLPAIVHATQASARAIASMNKWSFVMRDMKHAALNGTDPHASAKYQQASMNYYRAKLRYRNAQHTLAINPLPGDDA